MRQLLRSGSNIEWARYTPKVVKHAASPLLLIHGFGCGKDDWGVLTRRLGTRSQRPVLYFDNRGIGGSAAPNGPYTVSQMAADALSVVEAAGAERVDVLGISLGGMIAQEFAITHPERTSALILGCTSHGGREAFMPPDAFLQLCAAWAAEPEPNDSARIDDFIRMSLPPSLSDAAANEVFLGQFKAAFLQTSRPTQGLQGQLAAMGRFNSTKQLSALACNTLVITGDCDAVVPPANSESLASRIPGARLETWSGAGHFWWATKPIEVNDLLADFLLASDPT